MLGCSIVCCQSKHYAANNIAFFHFPSNPEVREVWRIRTGRPQNWKPTKNSVICSKHFRENQISRVRRSILAKSAVPTLDIPGHDYSRQDIRQDTQQGVSATPPIWDHGHDYCSRQDSGQDEQLTTGQEVQQTTVQDEQQGVSASSPLHGHGHDYCSRQDSGQDEQQGVSARSQLADSIFKKNV